MPDWTITIQKTGERTSAPQRAKDGTMDGNKPISTGVVTVTSDTGEVSTFNFTSGGYGKGAMPGLDDPNNTRQYELEWDRVFFNQTDAQIKLGSPFEDSYGNDSWIRFKDDPALMGTRNGFGFHPDGKYAPIWNGVDAPATGQFNDGTAGCVGIEASKARDFFKILEDIPKNQRPQKFTVLPSDYGPDQKNKIKQEKKISLSAKDKTYQIQAALKLSGFDPNGIDGGMGKGCAGAVQKYLATQNNIAPILTKKVNDLVKEVNKPFNGRDQALINDARNAIHTHFAERIKNDPNFRSKLSEAALSNVTALENADNNKIANAIASLIDPNTDVNIEGNVSDMTVTVLQANAAAPAPAASTTYSTASVPTSSIVTINNKTNTPSTANTKPSPAPPPPRTDAKADAIEYYYSQHDRIAEDIAQAVVAENSHSTKNGVVPAAQYIATMFNEATKGKTEDGQPLLNTNEITKIEQLKAVFQDAGALSNVKGKSYAYKIEAGDVIFFKGKGDNTEKLQRTKKDNLGIVTSINEGVSEVNVYYPESGSQGTYDLDIFKNNNAPAQQSKGIKQIGNTDAFLDNIERLTEPTKPNGVSTYENEKHTTPKVGTPTKGTTDKLKTTTPPKAKKKLSIPMPGGGKN